MDFENKRRDRLYIIAEILKIAKGGSLKTQITYRANLSFAQLNEYLSFLAKMNFLKLQKENKTSIYMTTQKGEKFLDKYREISDLLGRSE